MNWFDPATRPIEMPKDEEGKPLTKADVETSSKKLQEQIDELINGTKK